MTQIPGITMRRKYDWWPDLRVSPFWHSIERTPPVRFQLRGKNRCSHRIISHERLKHAISVIIIVMLATGNFALYNSFVLTPGQKFMWHNRSRHSSPPAFRSRCDNNSICSWMGMIDGILVGEGRNFGQSQIITNNTIWTVHQASEVLFQSPIHIDKHHFEHYVKYVTMDKDKYHGKWVPWKNKYHGKIITTEK